MQLTAHSKAPEVSVTDIYGKPVMQRWPMFATLLSLQPAPHRDNPSIFDKAISGGNNYDAAIADLLVLGQQDEDLFFSLALQDLTRAAELFKPAFDASRGVDGYASLEVSPFLADNTTATIDSAVALHARARRDHLFIKIPGTHAGIPAIEEAIYRGAPINVTLLFSREQYLASAEAWMRGIERRIAEGMDPDVDSVASAFISRWDVAVADKVPVKLKNKLGIAIAQRTYKAYDTLYVEALAAPDTINTLPDKTLPAFADHGKLHGAMPRDGGDCEKVIAKFCAAGIDDAALAGKLQRDDAAAFVKAWNDLLDRIAQKCTGVAGRRVRREARA